MQLQIWQPGIGIHFKDGAEETREPTYKELVTAYKEEMEGFVNLENEKR